jgi:hypothetical protein
MKAVRLAALVLIAGLLAASAQAQVVQRKNNSSLSTISSLATGNLDTNPTVGHLIAVPVQVQGTTVSSVTDTLGNTYVDSPCSPYVNTGGSLSNSQSIFYTVNASTGTNSVTAHFAGSSTYSTVTAYELSGIDQMSPLITDDCDSNGAGTSIETPTLSLSGDTALIVAIFESDDLGDVSGTPTPFTGYTFSKADGSAGYIWDGYHTAVVSDEQAGATVANSSVWGIVAAAFRVSTAAGRGCGLLLCGVGN